MESEDFEIKVTEGSEEFMHQRYSVSTIRLRDLDDSSEQNG